VAVALRHRGRLRDGLAEDAGAYVVGEPGDVIVEVVAQYGRDSGMLDLHEQRRNASAMLCTILD
jgi:hypothetical protein